MMYGWDEERAAFMADADSCTRYYEQMGTLLSPYLNKEDTLCDAGCGLGSLSAALLPYVKEVFAIDSSPLALSYAPKKKGLHPRLGDIASLPPDTPYDTMVFHFFGQGQQILSLAKSQCRGRVLVIKRRYRQHRFSKGAVPIKGDSFLAMQTLLEEKGIPYISRQASLELGQPLRSLQAARRFFALYSKDGSHVSWKDEELLSRLERRDDETFPYYLPQEKKVGILLFETKDIP